MTALSPSYTLLADRHHGLTERVFEVKYPVMDRLKRSDFLSELSGQVHLTEYDAVFSIDPGLTRRTQAATRLTTDTQ